MTRSTLRVLWWGLPVLLLADCRSAGSGGLEDGGAALDAAPVDGLGADGAVPLDSGAIPLAACPASGRNALAAVGPCFTFTPAQAGASSAGVNADVPHYALEPAGTPTGVLVVHLNSSLGTPASQIGDAQKNLYNALAEAGFHVLALSYRSDNVVGLRCGNDLGCYGPTRRTIVLGTYVAGADSSVATMREDEGIVQRLDGALRVLAASRPAAAWGAFVASAADPDVTKRIAWDKVVSSGHSQGGGHAAYLGKLFPLRRVVQLSSTCDANNGGTPASWTALADGWVTPPASAFVGFAAPNDTICPSHLAVWQHMGMAATAMHDDAATCGPGAHTATLACTANYPRWASLYL